MRVTLNQDELFGAVTDHLRNKLNLDDTASIEISFTAGRSPKGYTADVDITYPKSALVEKCTAKAHDDHADTTETSQGEPTVAVAAAPDPTAGGAVPDTLFGTP